MHVLLSFLFLFFKYLLPRDLIRESARTVQLSVDVVSALFGSMKYYVIVPLLFYFLFFFNENLTAVDIEKSKLVSNLSKAIL